MTAEEPLLVDRPREDVLRLRLHRPRQRNAVDRALVEALRDALNAPDARAVVLDSSSPDVFCAGADLHLEQDVRAQVSDMLYALYEDMFDLPVPLVAALPGPCVGAGAQLAVACDLRVAAPSARLRFPGPGHGLAVGAWALPALVGRGRALDLCLTMRWVEASEALAIGLVDRVTDDPGAAALELARHLAALRPEAVARTRRVVAAAARDGQRAALALEREDNRRHWSGSVAGLERLA